MEKSGKITKNQEKIMKNNTTNNSEKKSFDKPHAKKM